MQDGIRQLAFDVAAFGSCSNIARLVDEMLLALWW